MEIISKRQVCIQKEPLKAFLLLLKHEDRYNTYTGYKNDLLRFFDCYLDLYLPNFKKKFMAGQLPESRMLPAGKLEQIIKSENQGRSSNEKYYHAREKSAALNQRKEMINLGASRIIEIINRDSRAIPSTLKETRVYLKQKYDYQDNTLYRITGAVRAFLRFLWENSIIKENPGIYFKLPRRPEKIPRTVFEEDIEKIISAIDRNSPKGKRDYALVNFLYDTGMRREEITNLKEYNLFLDKGYVLIEDGKNSRERLIPLVERTIRYMKEYLEQKREGKIYAKISDYDHVFLNMKKGDRLSDKSIYDFVKNYGISVGLKISPHVMRSSLATHTLNRGVDITHIQDILGHKNISTTRAYLRVAKEDLKRILNEKHPSLNHQ